MEMPQHSAGGDDTDLYSDGMGADAPESDAKDKGKDDGRDSEEAILPRSICSGMDLKVGDKLSLEVTALHDKEISVKYAPEDEGGEDSSAGDDKASMPAEMASGGNDMYD